MVDASSADAQLDIYEECLRFNAYRERARAAHGAGAARAGPAVAASRSIRDTLGRERGEGPRPIAVATQFAGEEGATLVNDAERFAEAAWQRHFRRDRIPPIWIQRVIYGEDRRSGHISSTTFQVVGTRANTDSTRHLTGAELRRRNSQTWLDASSTWPRRTVRT